MKRRVVSVLLCTVLAVSMMAGCGSGSGSGGSDSDMEYVKDKGTLIVGITNFEPMDYQDENGDGICDHSVSGSCTGQGRAFRGGHCR